MGVLGRKRKIDPQAPQVQRRPVDTPVKEDEHGVQLGKEYMDVVSGFIGTATTAVTFLNGCVRYELMGKVSEGNEGKQPSVHAVDLQDLRNKDGSPLKTRAQRAMDQAKQPPAQLPARTGTGGARSAPTRQFPDTSNDRSYR